MPWTASWHDDNETIIILTPGDPWTWDDFKAQTALAQQMTRSKSHTVHLIYDLSGELSLPDSPSWDHLRHVHLNTPDNRGLIILVAAPLYIQTMIEILKSVIPDRAPSFRLLATLDEALASIDAWKAGGESGAP